MTAITDTPLPCPFCGAPAITFQWNGATQAQCSSGNIDCPGTDCYCPVPLWNRRAAVEPMIRAAEAAALERAAQHADAGGIYMGSDGLGRAIYRPITGDFIRAIASDGSVLDAVVAERTRSNLADLVPDCPTQFMGQVGAWTDGFEACRRAALSRIGGAA